VLKWLGRLLLALLLSLLVGLAIGTWLRLRLERPVYYIGAAETPLLTPLPLGGPPSRACGDPSLEPHLLQVGPGYPWRKI
jgi:hypothetical protein